MQYFKKTALLLLVTLCCFGTAFAQKANKMDKKAMEKVEKLNQQLIAGDATAGLTAEQMEASKEIYAEMMAGMKAARKGTTDKAEQKEQMKAIRKAANKRVTKEVLTKEQRKAKKAGKE